MRPARLLGVFARRSGVGLAVLVLAAVSSACSTGSPSASPSTVPAAASTPPTTSVASLPPAGPPPSPPPSNGVSSLPTSPPTRSTPTTAERDLLDGISWTSVPDDVIVPTDAASLDPETNPINGRRGGSRSSEPTDDCATEASRTCLIRTLDTLGFDVSSGDDDGRDRQVRRATAVVQLDAGLPMTGVADDDLLGYLGIGANPEPDAVADEVRQIGTSAEGRPITALRYGRGPTTVLVVGQTHGDEEGGLRVLLRARTLPVPDELTLWVVPTMNPDGLYLDTRFLADGADPNRHAPSTREQRAIYDFALVERPSLSVWYHQNYGWVGGSGASALPALQYQQHTGLGTLKRSGDCAKGFMWCPIDDALGSSSILVELPDVLTPADAQLHAAALLEVAADQAP